MAIRRECRNEEGLLKYVHLLLCRREFGRVIENVDELVSKYHLTPSCINSLYKYKREAKNNLTTTTKQKVKELLDIKPPKNNTVIQFGEFDFNNEKKHLKYVQDSIIYNRALIYEDIRAGNAKLEDLKIDVRYGSLEDRTSAQSLHLAQYHKNEDNAEKYKRASSVLAEPFFARMDFDNYMTKQIIYLSKIDIGEFVNNTAKRIYYQNWRAPIASLFYKFGTPMNNVSFEKEDGTPVFGDIKLTARFVIENNTIKEATYTNVQGDGKVASMGDEILQKKLSKGSSEKMTEIVNTIQPEQDKLIRHNADEDMIIQGSAGAGKTAIALHRLAYLKYSKQYLNDEVLFISPNEDFSEYVSDVFPELGEFRIPIKTFNEVTDEIFNDNRASNKESLSIFVDKNLRNHKNNERAKVKFTKSFAKKVYALCRKIEKEGSIIKAYNQKIETLNTDINIAKSIIDNADNDNRVAINKINSFNKEVDGLKKEIGALRKKLMKKLEVNASNIKEEAEEIDLKELELKAVQNEIKKKQDLIKKIKTIVQKNKLEISKKEERIAKLKEEISNKLPTGIYFKDNKAIMNKKPEDYLEEVCEDGNYRKEKYENLPYYNMIRFVCCTINGKNVFNNHIKHIVIDEAQDYVEMCIYFLRQAFPNAIFTILGDIHQNVNPLLKYNTMKDLLPNAGYFEINSAYRSSPEIVNYCNKILNIKNVKPMRQSQGIEVKEYKPKPTELIETIINAVEQYRNLGLKRIGIITRTTKEATKLNEVLTIIKGEKWCRNVHVISVCNAKGLEYDAVVVVNTFSKEEKELLYVASSRAQHGLTIIKIDKISFSHNYHDRDAHQADGGGDVKYAEK